MHLDQKPDLVVHCDWSTDPNKRWMAVAHRDSGRWHIGEPEPVGTTTDFLQRLRRRASSAKPRQFVGFDFPIGVPKAYGEQTGLIDFLAALKTFGHGDWSNWFHPCDDRTQISIRRPFYPARPGGRRREHLLTGLGLANGEDLLRECERRTPSRQAACSLFWTLGGNQVGKAAAAGWREILIPNLEQIAVWPFAGSLKTLLDQHDTVVAETYPGDVYGQIGIARRPVWSKRTTEGRASVAGPLLQWLETRVVDATDALIASISNGFPNGARAEDQFDAVVGLLGMLDVIEERRSPGCPGEPALVRWEGWILGMEK